MAVRGARTIRDFGVLDVWVLRGRAPTDRRWPAGEVWSDPAEKVTAGGIRVASGLDGLDSVLVNVVSGMLEQIGGTKRKRLISSGAGKSNGACGW